MANLFRCGGDKYNTKVTQLVEDYRPTGQAWTTQYRMVTGKRATWAGSVQKLGTKVYIMCGHTYSAPTNVIDVFEMKDKTCTTFTYPYSSHGVIGGVYNDTLYGFAGSNSGNKVCKCDMSTKTWTTLTDLPYTINETMGCMIGSKMYIPNYRVSTTNNKKGFYYDVTTMTYDMFSVLDIASYQNHCEPIGNDMYVFFGRTNAASLSSGAKYDTTTQTWSSLGSLGSIYTASCAFGNDGRYIYWAGANNGTGTGCGAFDITTNTYSLMNSIQTSPASAGGIVYNGTFYVFGEGNSNSNIVQYSTLYDNKTNVKVTIDGVNYSGELIKEV